MEDDTPMGRECSVCGMVNACICEFERDYTWTTKTGEKIAIGDMKDSHLLNTDRMLRQYIENEKFYLGVLGTPWAPRGDGACEAFEQEMDDVIRLASAARAWLPIMYREIKRRKLEQLPLKNPYKPMPKMELVEDLGCGRIYRIIE